MEPGGSPCHVPHTLRALARLLAYPDGRLRDQLAPLRDALHAERALSSVRLAELDELVAAIARVDALDAEARYVALFDRGRSTSLHLFEHVHGDSRDRGPAMVDLAKTYEEAGLHLATGELPDYLPIVLEFASTQPRAQARALLGEIAHILNVLHEALLRERSPYAAVPGALLEIAGETPRAVEIGEDAPLDATWEEPPAFDGCSAKGQAAPGTPQPIHMARRERAATGVRP